MSGVWGKILRVNLSNSSIVEEAIPIEWTGKLLGGRGIAVRYLIEEVPRGADPLGPENELIFMAGLLTGTPTPTASKHIVVAKSPLTGIIGMAIAGGFWSSKLKKSGLDGIIFQGISPRPVYLVIDDGVPELKEAGHLWGKNTFETNETVLKELGVGFCVTSIGTAGENLVKYASIVDNNERASGRCGLGAVMGSKRLKAVAVKGKKTIPVANKTAFKESEKKHYALINGSIVKSSQETYGTPRAVDVMNSYGYMPNRNWQSSYMNDLGQISGETYNKRILAGTWSCAACSNNCSRVVEVKEGKYPGFKGRGPEYESIWAWGALSALNDIEAVAWATRLCNDYGVDTMSCGSTMAFAMECYERGILKGKDTDGLELKFGNIKAALSLIPKIARREGFGDLLADGTRIMARKLGNGTEKFAMNVKGLELAGYECRGSKIIGLAYAVGSRGGCHTMGNVQLPAIVGLPVRLVDDTTIQNPLSGDPQHVRVLKDMEDAETALDCIGSCKFVMGIANSYHEVLAAISNVIGREFTLDEYKKNGERTWNIERIFNVREGITTSDDSLPARLLEEPLAEGKGKGHVAAIDDLLDAYYELRGWDRTGKPTGDKLRELGLEDLIKYLDN